MIEQAALKKGHYYIGTGRFSGVTPVALWDGDLFRGLTYKLGYYTSMTCEYGDKGFTPLKEVSL